jgi:tubulin polyglutamylase TTLL5
MYSKFNKVVHMDNPTALLFKLLKCDIKLIRSIFTLNGFSATDSHDWNCLWINSSGKSYLYENLNEYQKVNHFPHSYELTRKDKLSYNIAKMQSRFGEIDFEIMPESYVLPDQFDDFYDQY